MPRLTCRTLLAALTAALALTAFTAASALAAGAPIVETKPATAVRGAEATLHGKVNPNEAETKDWYEYGTTTSYGSRSREQTTKVTKEPIISIEGLNAKTTYHFRMVASNSYGTSYGNDEEFTTPVEPEFVGYSSRDTEAALPEPRIEFGSREVECSAGTMVGTITGARSWSGQLKFTGCYYGHYACQTEGAAHAEIATETLTGKPVYSSHTSKLVALLLTGRERFIKLSNTCLFGGWPVKGGLLVPISPVNSNTGTHYISLEGSRGIETAHEYEYQSDGVWHTATAQLVTEREGNTAIKVGSGIRLISSPFEIVA